MAMNMNDFSPLHLISALALVGLNGFFVASEFAFVKARKTRLQELEKGGDKRAKRAINIIENLNAYLTANQLGITLASLGLGWLGEPAVAQVLFPIFTAFGADPESPLSHGVATVLAFVVVMILHTVLGELVPKSLAILNSEKVALLCARPLHWFYRFAYPIIFALNGMANVLVRALGSDPNKVDEDAHSVEELRMVVLGARKGGEIEASTEKLLTNLLDYQHRTARELMTPRKEVVTVHPNDPVATSIGTICASDYSRVPVYDTDEQRIDGYIHVKDVAIALHAPAPIDDLKKMLRSPTIVPESLPADKIRQKMQNTHTHLAFVVDEFGDFAGIITMEDILEEIVGQIQDESDRESPDITQIGRGTWLVDGGLLLERAERELGLNLKPYPEGMDTLAGYVLTRLGRMAREGDQVATPTHSLHVLRTENLRIVTIRVQKKRLVPEVS